MLITSTLFYMQFAFIQPVYASPDLYYSKPTSHSETLTPPDFEVGHPATDAYDKDNATYAEFNYELAGDGAGTYYFDLIDFTKAGGTISQVDFKMKYSATAGGKGGTYSIQFSIDGSTWVTKVAATDVAHSVPGAGCDVWASEPRPGGGSWTWTDINNIQFRVETVWARRGTGMFQLYEGWVTVTFTPPASPTVYIDPSSKVDTTTLTPPAEKYSLALRPDAEGTYDEWYAWDDEYTPGTADYTNWDEATPDDGDYNFIDDEYYYQSSGLADHTSETWSIAKVKLTARASASQYSDDVMIPFLIVGGTDYDGVIFTNVSTSWTEYTTTWGLNPDTMDQWAWSEIDGLEAGLYTDSGDDFTWDFGLEIYVSQLYIEVFGPGIKFDICVDYIVDLWQWQFEMYYDPDVLQGVYADEANEYPVGADPDDFLAGNGGTVIIAPGPGWNNTLGKLWLTSANLLQKIGPVTGGGRLATFIMECGSAEGESTMTLGSLTAVYDIITGYIQPLLGHGYFRNVALAELPTASFTWAPDQINGYSPPEPLEGYNVTFDASASTPDGGTIVEYKWYFGANFPFDTVHEIVTTTSTTITRNYTARSPPGGVYNVTLVVKDSNGAVDSAKDSFQVNAHDIAIIGTQLWDVPEAPENVTVGETAKINVTVANQGHYNEIQINVSVYWEYLGTLTFIGNDTGISVNAGQEVNATVTWDTSGLTQAGENVFYSVWANATTVDYEYDQGDNTGSATGIRVKPSAVPEFPLGAAMEISLVAAVIYLWWRSRRKRKPYQKYPRASIQTLKRI